MPPLGARARSYADYCPCVAGHALAFRQSAYHEGEPVSVGGRYKYLIRTDFMFKRTPPICDDSSDDREAFDVYRQAMQTERDDAMEAVRLYQKCAKLSPKLARILGV